ncbi:MAG: hypothetical protein H6545_01760 [Bacteroidales bacterium]|nr:hypothetical protein [Bacteroidales bacterium]MCB9027833.1 hypothetical protein [Bacteroidales bacterium]HOO66057.1 hypothetical protein [Bacteroidales bacterium]HPE21833.1 hypothetical protein [Bacteroidales bacterium]HPJ05029.1 hypothetical protein [Bacteroidales bacterium]
MEDIGSIIFYVILGIIALIGSVQGKGKKKTGAPRPVQRKPGTFTGSPPARSTQAPARPQASSARPQTQSARPLAASGTPQPHTGKSASYMPSDPFLEGRYDEPMAGEFSREGSYSETMAGDFSWEGSKRGGLAEVFAQEGSMAGSTAAAFASEGASVFGDTSIREFVHTEISDSEIGDAPDYDYNAAAGTDMLTEGFDLKKAVIYSALLDRKEYSY